MCDISRQGLSALKTKLLGFTPKSYHSYSNNVSYKSKEKTRKETAYMEKKLSPWSKSVKIAMIKRDWSVRDLANAVKMSREYVSSVINGRVYSGPAVKMISDVLNIPETARSLNSD